MTQDKILQIVLNSLTTGEKNNCVVFLDSRCKQKGDKFPIGRRQMTASNSEFYVFADLMPGANWGHPAAYLLIDAETGAIERINDSFPPFSGAPPSEFVILFRSDQKHEGK